MLSLAASIQLFNPLCFVGHNHDFAVLELRCNPIAGIARATRRFINRFNEPIITRGVSNGIANV